MGLLVLIQKKTPHGLPSGAGDTGSRPTTGRKPIIWITEYGRCKKAAILSQKKMPIGATMYGACVNVNIRRGELAQRKRKKPKPRFIIDPLSIRKCHVKQAVFRIYFIFLLEVILFYLKIVAQIFSEVPAGYVVFC
ncbi:hypothetical protein QA596_01875 [Balneolales bacterium ANBcel1]|nr:hypothetical protein [Balneolales bacterium ANBcel1]